MQGSRRWQTALRKFLRYGERRANRHGWYRVHVTFTDGTRISFHEVAHVLFDATGVVKVEFDKFKAHCG